MQSILFYSQLLKNKSLEKCSPMAAAPTYPESQSYHCDLLDMEKPVTIPLCYCAC